MNDRSGTFHGVEVPVPPRWFENVILQRTFGGVVIAALASVVLMIAYPNSGEIWRWITWLFLAVLGLLLLVRVISLDVSLRRDYLLVRNLWSTHNIQYESISRVLWPRELATHRLKLELKNGTVIVPTATRTAGIIDGGLDAAYHIHCRVCVLRADPLPSTALDWLRVSNLPSPPGATRTSPPPSSS